MKLNLNLKKKCQRFCLVLICLVVLIFQSDIPNLKALTMDNFQSEMVTEELRPVSYTHLTLPTNREV